MRNARRLGTPPALALLVLLAAFGAHGSRASAGSGRRAESTAAQSQEKYRVFCVNGKVDFGSRSLQDMQWDFGKNVCQLGEFDTYRKAREDVRKRGGVGADCRCQ
jgi:hypothetical protein